jgi:hypothetical protein
MSMAAFSKVREDQLRSQFLLELYDLVLELNPHQTFYGLVSPGLSNLPAVQSGEA